MLRALHPVRFPCFSFCVLCACARARCVRTPAPCGRTTRILFTVLSRSYADGFESVNDQWGRQMDADLHVTPCVPYVPPAHSGA